MKDVLIYGALVAAVLGVGASLISNFRGTVNNMGGAINGEISNQQQALIDAINGDGSN